MAQQGRPIRPRCSLAAESCATRRIELRTSGPGGVPSDGLSDNCRRTAALTALLETQGRPRTFPGRNGGPTGRARDHIHLTLRAGDIAGLAGQSGCGKTTSGRSLVGLERPNAGTVRLCGGAPSSLRDRRARRPRRAVRHVLPDAFAALSPRQRIGQGVGQAWLIHGRRNSLGRRQRAAGLIADVGALGHALTGTRRCSWHVSRQVDIFRPAFAPAGQH